MITTTGGLDTRINIQQIIENQLPEFLLASRKDLIKLLWGKESRLNKGWRYNIFTKNSRYL